MPHIVDQFAQNVFFAGEITIERPLGHAGRACDVADARAVIARLAEGCFGRFQDLRTRARATGRFGCRGPRGCLSGGWVHEEYIPLKMKHESIVIYRRRTETNCQRSEEHTSEL